MITTATTSDYFGEVISEYSRADAIEDGILIDAMQDELADVSKQHYKYPIAMTAGVWDLIERAVANTKCCNDVAGVWHDILHMSQNGQTKVWPTGCLFQVMITGTGRRRFHTLKMECGPGDTREPVLTVMLPGED